MPDTLPSGYTYLVTFSPRPLWRHAIDTRFVLAPDAAAAKDLMSGRAASDLGVGAVDQAVMRLGPLLIVKLDVS